MPYLKENDKLNLEILSHDAGSIYQIGTHCKTAGELNYTITRIIQGYMRTNGKCYQTMNDIIGALEGAKMEFYRRTIAPYETLKIEQNGDVEE